MKDSKEVVEKKTVINLILFIKRCLDIIEFLKIVSFDGDQSLFQKMLAAINSRNIKRKEELLVTELASTCFKDLVMEGGNDSSSQEGSAKAEFLKNLFEASVLVANKQETKTIKQ